MAASSSTLTTLEALLREKKLDVTLVSSRPWSRDEREARLAPTGWDTVDQALGGGLPRGECSEIVGPASSGRTAALCALLASAAERGEVAALVDTTDSFDPVSAAALGVDLSRLLWARGTMVPPRQQTRASRGRSSQDAQRDRRTQSSTSPSQVLRSPRYGPADAHEYTHARSRSKSSEAADPLTRLIDRAIKSFGLILQSGGFGVVALDLADIPIAVVRRLPFTTWMRVQRLLEGHETVGLVLAQEPLARSARGVTVQLASTNLADTSQAAADRGSAARADRASTGRADIDRVHADGANARLASASLANVSLANANRISAAPPGFAKQSLAAEARLARSRASRAVWSGVSDRARLFAGFALRPDVQAAHRIDQEPPHAQVRVQA